MFVVVRSALSICLVCPLVYRVLVVLSSCFIICLILVAYVIRLGLVADCWFENCLNLALLWFWSLQQTSAWPLCLLTQGSESKINHNLSAQIVFLILMMRGTLSISSSGLRSNTLLVITPSQSQFTFCTHFRTS